MRRQLSKVATSIGLATALVIISGSIVGGIALAADHNDPTAPAVSTTDQDGPDDDADHDANEDADRDNDEDVCDPGEWSDDDCDASPEATLGDGDDHGGDRQDGEHHGDDPDEDRHGSNEGHR